MRFLPLLLFLLLLPGLLGCSLTLTAKSKSITIEGRASLAPVNGGLITAYTLKDNGEKGEKLGSATTGPDGSYSLKLLRTDQPICLVLTGGKYQNEADGTTTSLGANEEFKTLVTPTLSDSGVTASISPLTDMAAARAAKRMSDGAVPKDAIDGAYLEMASLAGLDSDIRSLRPVDLRNPAQVNAASEADKKYSLVLAGMAVAAKNDYPTDPHEAYRNLAKDFKDGAFDGYQGDDAIRNSKTGANVQTDAWSGGVSQGIQTWLAGGQNTAGVKSELAPTLAAASSHQSDFNLKANIKSNDRVEISWTPEADKKRVLSDLLVTRSGSANPISRNSGLEVSKLELTLPLAGVYTAQVTLHYSDGFVSEKRISFTMVGATPTATPTATATPSPTATSSPTATATPAPTATPTSAPSPTATPSPAATATPTPSPTAIPSATPSPSSHLARPKWTFHRGGAMTGYIVNGAYAWTDTKILEWSDTYPKPRQAAMSWTDKEGNMWLFGGRSAVASSTVSGNLNDLWKFDGETWTLVTGSQSLDSYGVMEGPQAQPSGRTSSTALVDAQGLTWFFGGYGIASNSPYNSGLDDLWTFDGKNWELVSGLGYGSRPIIYTEKEGTPHPGSRMEVALFDDPKGECLYLFGGYHYGYTPASGPTVYGGPLNDLWCFHKKTRTWEFIRGQKYTNTTGSRGELGVTSPNNIPYAVYRPVFWSKENQSFLFGGVRVGNELWNLQDTLWTWIGGGSVALNFGTQGESGKATQAPATQSVAQWQDNEQRLWMYGGYGADTVNGRYDHLWMHDGQNWTWVDGTGLDSHPYRGVPGEASELVTPGSRTSSLTWYDPRHNKIWLFGGHGTSDTVNFSNELWSATLPDFTTEPDVPRTRPKQDECAVQATALGNRQVSITLPEKGCFAATAYVLFRRQSGQPLFTADSKYDASVTSILLTFLSANYTWDFYVTGIGEHGFNGQSDTVSVLVK